MSKLIAAEASDKLKDNGNLWLIIVRSDAANCIKGEVIVAETFIIFLLIDYFIYIVAFEVPKDINKIQDEIRMVNLHLQEMELILNEIDNKLDNKLDNNI
jgi:hypothetical protein